MHPRPWLMPTSTLYLLNAQCIAQVNTLCNGIYGSAACGVCIYGLYSSFLCRAFYNSSLEYKSCIHKAKKGSPFALTKSFLAPVDIAPYGGRRPCVCNVQLDYVYIHTQFLFESRFGQHCTVNGFISEDALHWWLARKQNKTNLRVHITQLGVKTQRFVIGQHENAN